MRNHFEKCLTVFILTAFILSGSIPQSWASDPAFQEPAAAPAVSTVPASAPSAPAPVPAAPVGQQPLGDSLAPPPSAVSPVAASSPVSPALTPAQIADQNAAVAAAAAQAAANAALAAQNQTTLAENAALETARMTQLGLVFTAMGMLTTLETGLDSAISSLNGVVGSLNNSSREQDYKDNYCMPALNGFITMKTSLVAARNELSSYQNQLMKPTPSLLAAAELDGIQAIIAKWGLPPSSTTTTGTQINFNTTPRASLWATELQKAVTALGRGRDFLVSLRPVVFINPYVQARLTSFKTALSVHLAYVSATFSNTAAVTTVTSGDLYTKTLDVQSAITQYHPLQP